MESQHPEDTKADPSSPSNQEINANWIAIGNIIASALVNAANSAPPTAPPPDTSREKKSTDRFNRWLSIVTLAVTVLIQGGLAWYINYQNQQFQINLFSRQATATAKSSVAQLEISCYSLYCSDGFTLVNIGGAIANNVQMTVNITGISYDWQRLVKGIDNLPLNAPPGINSKTISYNPPLELKHNNAYMVNIISLGPANPQPFSLNPSLLMSSSTVQNTYDKTIDVTLFYGESYGKAINNKDVVAQVVRDYFDSQFMIAQFNIFARCDNCGATIYYTGSFPTKPNNLNSFVVSSKYYVSPVMTDVSSQKIQNGYQWKVKVHARYLLPNLGVPEISSPLFLQLKYLPGSPFWVFACQPASCTNFS